MTVFDPSPSPDVPRVPLDWGAALAEHGRWLRTVVSARLREPQAVDEVMQEISLAAVEQRSPLADPSRLSAWLYRLAVLKVLMYRRRCGRRSKLHGRYASRVRNSGEGSDEGDPLGWLISEERADLVRWAIARIPEREAEILRLKYSEQWSYRELATRLGLSESAVESRLHRARRRLRDELDKFGDLTEECP